MVLRSMRTATIALLSIVGITALPAAAQKPATGTAAGTKVTQFMGLEGVKPRTGGDDHARRRQPAIYELQRKGQRASEFRRGRRHGE